MTFFKVPKVIFHYCDLNAFISILNNKKIWLSNSYLMNDTFENMWINRHLEWVRKKYKNYDKLIERIIRSYKSNPEVPYISCFSEEGDTLSQWRAYANDGMGVAIGFNTDFFNHVTILDNSSPSASPIILSPVIYENQIQQSLLQEIFDIVIQKYNTGQEEDAHQIGHTTLKRVSMISKNHAFKEEKEYRMIYTPYHLNLIAEIKQVKDIKNLANLPVKFRIKEDHVISYFEFDISEGKVENAIKSIILGPKNKISDYELKVILNAYRINVENIHRSRASYR